MARRGAVRMQGCLQCRPLQVARAGVSRPCTWRTPTPSPARQQGAATKGSVRSGRTAMSTRRAVPASHQLNMDAPSAASETGLGHVFVSLFPGARLCSAASDRSCAPKPLRSWVLQCQCRRDAGPMRYTASLLMPLSAMLSIGGALYGHQLAYYLASLLPLAQARPS